MKKSAAQFKPVRRSNSQQVHGWCVCDVRTGMCYGELFTGPTAWRDCLAMCAALNRHPAFTPPKKGKA
jgi:hypothetical protein